MTKFKIVVLLFMNVVLVHAGNIASVMAAGDDVDAWGNVSATATTLNFGKAIIFANTSTISIDKNNTPIWMRAMKSTSGDNITAGELVFSGSLSDTVIIKPDITNLNQVIVNESNCKPTLNNLQISPSSIALTAPSSSKTIIVGASLQIVGRCANGEKTPYTSNISIPYSVLGSDNSILGSYAVNLPIKFAVENKTDIVEDNDLNFGTVITNGEAGILSVSPLGGISQISDSLISSGTVTAGEISIYGPLNLAITNVSFDSSVTLYNGTNTMIVDNFTLSPGKSFSLHNVYGDLGYEKLKIGGTLNVKQNQPAGEYSGILNISISY